MKVKVSEAPRPVLDLLVARIELPNARLDVPSWADKPWVRVTDPNGVQYVCPRYSTDWSQGGPIIEREGICLLDPLANQNRNGLWHANCGAHGADGETALIAAMRCFVASKLGDEVDVPEELLS